MQSVTTSNWTDFLTGMESEQRWLLAVIAIGCSIALILGLAGILSSMFSSIQRHRAETNLKREMIERGMSADEIATVILASASKNDSSTE
jgi:hypothetical protein